MNLHMGNGKEAQGTAHGRGGGGIADEMDGEVGRKGEGFTQFVADEEAGDIAAHLRGIKTSGEQVGASEKEVMEEAAGKVGLVESPCKGLALRIGGSAVAADETFAGEALVGFAGEPGPETVDRSLLTHHPFRVRAGQADDGSPAGERVEKSRDLGLFAAHHIGGVRVRIVAADSGDDEDLAEGRAGNRDDGCGELREPAGRGHIGCLDPAFSGADHAAHEDAGIGMGVFPRAAVQGEDGVAIASFSVADAVGRGHRGDDLSIDEEFGAEVGRTPVDGDEGRGNLHGAGEVLFPSSTKERA